MLAALDLVTRVAIGVGLVLAAAWLAVQALELVLRRRGSVWHVPQERRGRRVAETRLLAVLFALVLGALAGWLGRCLGVAVWLGIAIAAAVALWATRRVANAFAQTLAMGTVLLPVLIPGFVAAPIG